jgi:hypothetical protein
LHLGVRNVEVLRGSKEKLGWSKDRFDDWRDSRSEGGKMGRMAKVALLVAVLTVLTRSGAGQEQSKSEGTPSAEARPKEVTPLRVGVTFVEFEGDRKVKSLPYTLVVVADAKNPKSIVKVGSRVPVYTGKDSGMQYLDVGSNIDCTAFRAKDGEFHLTLDLERSWVEGDVSVAVEKGNSSQSSVGQFPEPIVRQFRSELSLMLRDGQSVESTFATDPLSGKVFKVEVSLTVLK